MKYVLNRIIIIIFIVLLTISVFGVAKTFAKSEIFKVTKVKIADKSDTVIVNDVSLDEDVINNDIVLTNKDDYIKYNITFKNSSDKDYLIKSISIDEDSNYLEYSYNDLVNTKIKSNEEKTIKLKITYKKEADKVNISTKKINLSIEYDEDKEGSNPDTFDNIYKYILLFIISSGGLIITISRKKRSNKGLFALLVGLLILPLSVSASNDKFIIVFNNNIKAREYNVVLDKDNGEDKETIKVVKGNNISNIDDPIKTGYVFSGWHLNDSIYDVTTPVVEDIELKAYWDENPEYNFYDITFKSNGGTSVDSQRIMEGDKVVEPKPPTKKYYIFSGWYLNGVLYDFESPVSSDITLTAEWYWNPEIIRYDVTFDSNKGTDVESQKVVENEKAIEPEDPYRYGYILKGWYLDDELFDFDTPITRDIHLVAKWKEDPEAVRLNLIFDSDGGSEVPSQRVIAGDFAKRPENPTKDNHAFIGWHEIIDPYIFPNLFDFDNERITYDNTKLIAFWEPVGEKHLVKFDTGEGGSFVPDQTVINNQKVIKPTNPEKDGVSFKEWQLDGEKYDFDTPVTESMTLTAKWVHMCGDYEIVEGKYDSNGIKVDFKYSDCFFNENPATYNNHMATMSHNLAHASNQYIENGDYSNGAKNVVDILNQSGFDDIYVSDSYKEKPTADSIGYVIASKDVVVPGSVKKVISITIRSAGYEAEWASNVTIGKNGEALGFKNASEQVLTGIRQYLNDYNLNQDLDDGNLVFWLQGFSRGGATANLTAKKLIDSYQALGNRIYAYCIEAPQGGIPALETGDYGSIHNVINTDDIVPYVAPALMGFKRYGIDHYLSSDDHDWIQPGTGRNMSDNFPFTIVREERIEKVNDQLKEIFNNSDRWKNYEPYRITKKHITYPTFQIEDDKRQELTMSYLYRFMDALVYDGGEPNVTRDIYVDDGLQDAASRFMIYLNSNVNFKEFMNALNVKDFVSISGGEAIVAIFWTLSKTETVDGVVKLRVAHDPIASRLYASAIRDIVAGNSEIMTLLETYPGGKLQALRDIETITYRVVKSCDYIDDYATLVLNAADLLTNHATFNTLAWLRSYDSWYYGIYE